MKHLMIENTGRETTEKIKTIEEITRGIMRVMIADVADVVIDKEISVEEEEMIGHQEITMKKMEREVTIITREEVDVDKEEMTIRTMLVQLEMKVKAGEPKFTTKL